MHFGSGCKSPPLASLHWRRSTFLSHLFYLLLPLSLFLLKSLTQRLVYGRQVLHKFSGIQIVLRRLTLTTTT